MAIIAVAVAIYYPFSPGGRQGANMRRAERHIQTVRPQVAADPRFANVRLAPFTAQGGSLLVSGTVATKADAAALRELVEQSGPPVEMAFRVIVYPAATQSAATRPKG